MPSAFAGVSHTYGVHTVRPVARGKQWHQKTAAGTVQLWRTSSPPEFPNAAEATAPTAVSAPLREATKRRQGLGMRPRCSPPQASVAIRVSTRVPQPLGQWLLRAGL